MKRFIIIILLLLLIANFSYRIDMKKSPHELIGELMYFPSGIALKALSMGFYAPLADLVWLRFIQYYGEHRLSNTKFELMYHILDILTTLDSRFNYAYTLGSLMLSHDAERPDQAKILLKKGMMKNPYDWRYPYMYAFIHYLFLKDYNVARTYYNLSANKPDAPDMPKRWAAFVVYKKIGDLKTALVMWMDFYNNTKNPEEKNIAKIYIVHIKMELNIEFLNEKIQEFTRKIGRQPYDLKELIRYGIIDSIPTEPHGEKFVIKNGKVYTTWKRGK